MAKTACQLHWGLDHDNALKMQNNCLAEAGLQPQRQSKSLSPFAQTLNALPDLLSLLRMMAGRLSLAGLHLLITCQCWWLSVAARWSA